MIKRNVRKKLTPLQRRWLKRTMALLITGVALWLLAAPGSGLLSMWRQRADLQTLRAKNVELEQQNKALQAEVDRLQNDPKYLEEIARRQYDMLKDHESIYDFNHRKKK